MCFKFFIINYRIKISLSVCVTNIMFRYLGHLVGQEKPTKVQETYEEPLEQMERTHTKIVSRIC